jgi:hypothetical protein
MYFKDTYVLIMSYKAEITSFDEYRASSGCIKALSHLGDLEIEWSLASHLRVWQSEHLYTLNMRFFEVNNTPKCGERRKWWNMPPFSAALVPGLTLSTATTVHPEVLKTIHWFPFRLLSTKLNLSVARFAFPHAIYQIWKSDFLVISLSRGSQLHRIDWPMYDK